MRSGRSQTNRQLKTRPPYARASIVCALLACLLMIGAVGCTWTRPSLSNPLPISVFSKKDAEQEEGETSVASAASDILTPSATRMVSYVTGKTENVSRAQRLYQRAHTTFEKAKSAPKDDQPGLFADAAELFHDVQAFAPPALMQDAMYMEGESLFMSNQLTEARDVFETLQKDFPRNPHTDRTAARLFSIGKYWIDIDRAGGEKWSEWINPFDGKVPWIDASAHAIKVLDQIRFDDPTGRLADDATMAAAAEHIRKGEYLMADEFLTDLRETFSDSDHLFLAHLLGIRCKLEIYEGPRYSGLSLEEAGKLIQQTRRRFPKQVEEKKYAEMLARASAEVAYLKAGKLAYRAEYREKRGEYAAARKFYQQILRDQPSTPQAEIARKRLEQIGDLPAKPPQRLAFLTKVFPDSRKTIPLEMVGPDDNTEAESGVKTDDTGSNTGSFFR